MTLAPHVSHVSPSRGRWARALPRGLVLAGTLLLTACALPPSLVSPPQPPEQLAAAAPAARAVLAPMGVLRVGVYAGSPLSLLEHPGDPSRNAGLAHDLGRVMAGWLDVPFELVRFDRLPDLMLAMGQGEVDFTVTWTSETYGRDVNYSLPLLDLEQGYLAGPDTDLRAAADLNALAARQGGVKLGMLNGSGAQAPLARRHPQIEIVSLGSYTEASARLAARQINAFAASKSVLYPMAERLGDGARVLDGRWGLETVAIAIPKGRQAGMSYLSRFVLSVRREGYLQAAVKRADLRGAIEPAIR
ncbi:type 2 periplasmic-binding domain-containing protein [Hylemonella gracilis]|uniref:Extracellular solute-binding protein n=1 Tax=Hylemonella gracilis ATCC 19624 TaxID=887062 RepID=F3KVK9_9BURK|nr:transporter substrate-binding domain-containing protein [Hylemonella gracilis]EGI76192.1 extracellular solute-binding protein [Hylemonella gracilis ATCC 19624]